MFRAYQLALFLSSSAAVYLLLMGNSIGTIACIATSINAILGMINEGMKDE